MSTSSLRRTLELIEVDSQKAHQEKVRGELETKFVFVSRWHFFFLWLFWVPILRGMYFRQHERIRQKVAASVQAHVPLILGGIQKRVAGFDQWERENRSLGMGSESASRREREGSEVSHEHSRLLLEEIAKIRWVCIHFCGLQNPANMVRNPYPGYMSAEFAENYCEALLAAFK